jgi:tetratricopeptide (TPR) repeat protein
MLRRGRGCLTWVAGLGLMLAAGETAQGRPRPHDAGARRVEAAEKALRQGRYQEARQIGTELERKASVGVASVGAAGPEGANAGTIVAARAEEALGLYAEARQRLTAAARAAPDSLPVRDALMRLYDATGERTALGPLIDRTYEDWKLGRIDKTHAADLIAVATAVRLDNNWKDASDTLRDATRAEPRSIDANLDWGWIFLEKHSAANAELSFREVLKLDDANPDAHVGLARVVLEQRYDVAAAEHELALALAVNPHHARALAIRGELALDGEDFLAAAARVAEIRATNPRDGGAAALAAAAGLVLDDRATYERERDRHLTDHPGDGDFFAFVAEALTRHRRYDEARATAEEGVRADPQHARCQSTLGTTLLRLGDEAEGVEALRRAWKRDPYDVRTYNLLNLFEKVIPARYVTIETRHLRFRVEPEARPAIEAVVAPFLEETYRRYVERYGLEPNGPVVFELYGDPTHYAVRTVGLPGIGVAGVCFGRVITSQAPTNHAFNWGMVLAHELAHVFAIQISRSRVPRWFTEGLSELETMRARPEWSRHDDVALWGALRAGKLPTLVDLSTAFVHARDADEALRAYAHAAVAMEFLERRFGFAAIRGALAAYGRGERGAGVLERLAGLPADELERQFRADLERRFARYDRQFLPTQTLRQPRDLAEKRAASAVGEPMAQVEAGLAQLAEGDRAAAQGSLARAQAAITSKESGKDAGSVGGGPDAASAILFLTGELALANRQAEPAIAAFQKLLDLGGHRGQNGQTGYDGYDVRVRLALAEIHRKQSDRAEQHLRRAIEFDPSRVEPHALLVELFTDGQRDADRLTEAEAALALEPQNAKLAKETVLGLGRAGRAGRVVDLAAIAIFIDPADPDLHAALGRALATTGKTAAAAAAFERALLFAPADAAELHRALSDLYVKLGDAHKAEAHRAAAAAR